MRMDGRDKANRCFSLFMRTHLKILVSTAEIRGSISIGNQANITAVPATSSVSIV